MFWIYIVLLANGIPDAVAQEESGPAAVDPVEKVEGVKHVHPYEFPPDLITDLLDWNSGFINKKPVYATMYASMKHDIHFYIFPPNHCQSVWFCLGKDYNITKNGIVAFSVTKSCEESLRFFPLEQIVYHTKGGKANPYPYFSTLVEIIYQYTSEAQQQFIFKPDGEFDVEDIANVKKGSEIQLSLAGRQIIFLTSSPYCHVTVQQPFGGIAKGYQMKFEPQDIGEYYKAPYWPGNRDNNDKIRENLWLATPSMSFDPVEKRAGLKRSSVDCCPPTWEFEGFVSESEWNAYSKITYQKYKIGRRQSCEFSEKDKNEKGFTRYQSILVEVGKRCEWLRLCFDKGDKFCENDANTLSFIFAHDVYIPTDSDNARPFGLHRDQIDAIRLNFLIGYQGIELAYGFSNTLHPGITELMRLINYDGQNPQNLVINVAKAANCEARLTTDLASVNLRDGDETTLQCMWLSSCECYE